MQNRVDTKSMSDEHDDSEDKREEPKHTVSREEVLSPVREAGQEETTDREDGWAGAVHVEPVTGT